MIFEPGAYTGIAANHSCIDTPPHCDSDSDLRHVQKSLQLLLLGLLELIRGSFQRRLILRPSLEGFPTGGQVAATASIPKTHIVYYYYSTLYHAQRLPDTLVPHYYCIVVKVK